MNQIAIGDSSAWTVVDGYSIAPPCRSAALFLSFSSETFLQEKIDIQLAGTPAQISTALGTLEKIKLRAQAYARGEYAHPQLIRFQPTSAAAYYYAHISNIFFESNPNGYLTHQTGSLLITLHYTRPAYFDGDQLELPLTGRAGTDVTGGLAILNHTDGHAAHGNSVLIKAASALTDMPAPLRFELTNTYSTTLLKDIFVGAYHHPTVTAENIFFAHANSMSGGTQYTNPAAINEYYRTVSWTSSAWTELLNYGISLTDINLLDGRTFRPILHFYTPHAYTDLSLRLSLKRGIYTIQVCEPVYTDPNFQYVIFPPIQLPPNQLLRETLPHHVEIQVSGLKEDGSLASFSMDQLLLLPLDYGALYSGFFLMDQDDILIDDAFRGLLNVRYSAAGSETISHIRQGGPLRLYPNENTRLIFVLANSSNVIDIDRTATIRVYYRPRVRFL